MSFIDPHFIDDPPGGFCDEPPADVSDGQAFVQRVVEAVVSGAAWNETLLLIVYDEHGGFYDHVPPPPALRVSEDLPISTYGLRVPAFVVSPWVAASGVFGYDGDVPNPVPLLPSAGGAAAARARPGPACALLFDHTSILKTIARRFLSDQPPYLGVRYAMANDLSEVIAPAIRVTQFLPFIRYSIQFVQSGMMFEVTDGQVATGTMLRQSPARRLRAQAFSFEEAGSGFLYLRSHAGNLYITARAPDPANPSQLEVIQDAKYDPTDSAGQSRAALQRWKVSKTGVDASGAALYEIWSEAYPQQRLQPAEPGVPDSNLTLIPVVLAGNAAWRVASLVSA